MTARPGALKDLLEQYLHEIVVADAPPAAVLAAITNAQTVITDYGHPRPDEHTTFELGSITKTFTALLLADMVHRGEVAYHDPISAYLPTIAVPCDELAASVTLMQLATHTSGLARMPTNLQAPTHPTLLLNPFADYRNEHLYQATKHLDLLSAPGAEYRYSNFGIGLLGHLLANAADRDYPELIRERITSPLGMSDTASYPGPRTVTGHQHGHPMPPLEIHALAGAGVLRSSPADLLRYLTALLNPEATPLAPALRAVTQPRVARQGRQSICLVWNHRRFRFGDVIFHSGGTPGFYAFTGLCPDSGDALLALTNTMTSPNSRALQAPYDLLKFLARDSRWSEPTEIAGCSEDNPRLLDPTYS
jgi:D-alanyl-D-alanine-carboxypeptidase/D-alanyl-D-alanine-endopeptidase